MQRTVQSPDPQLQKEADRLTTEMVNQGRIIEGGWRPFRLLALPPDLQKEQLVMLRTVFFSGAHHMYTTLQNIPNSPSGDQIKGLIEKELMSFTRTMENDLEQSIAMQEKPNVVS